MKIFEVYDEEHKISVYKGVGKLKEFKCVICGSISKEVYVCSEDKSIVHCPRCYLSPKNRKVCPRFRGTFEKRQHDHWRVNYEDEVKYE